MNVSASAPFSADSSYFEQWTVESTVRVDLGPCSSTVFFDSNEQTVIPSSFVASVETTTKCGPTEHTVSARTSMYPTQHGAPFSYTCGKLAYPKQPGISNLRIKSTGTQVMTTQSTTSAPMMRPSDLSVMAMGKIPGASMLLSA